LDIDNEIMITWAANENVWYECHIYFTGYHRQSGFLGHENDANCNHQIEPNEPDASLEFIDYLETVFIQTGNTSLSTSLDNLYFICCI
jgi:hypothetical protein